MWFTIYNYNSVLSDRYNVHEDEEGRRKAVGSYIGIFM